MSDNNRNGVLFSKLRAQKKTQISQMSAKTVRTTNTTHANSISLSAGNLILGSSQNNRFRNDNIGTAEATEASAKEAAVSKGIEINTNNKNILDAENRILDSVKPKRSHQLEITYHEARVSGELILLNIEKYDDIQEGDLCELKTYCNKFNTKDSKSENVRKKIFFIAKPNVTEKSQCNIPIENKLRQSNNNNTVSVISGQLRSLIDLPVKSKVWIKVKSKKDYQADLVEINVKDCSLNRGDMWALSSNLQNTCVFSGQKLTFIETIRGTVKGIYRSGKKVLSGYIGESTRIVFRSESARLIFLIQITEEMWNFEETGEKLFQKMVNSLFPKIFRKWKKIDTHHSITIAFAISMDLSDSSFKDLKPGERLKNPVDHFRIVVDQVNIIHWVEIMETLKVEFSNIRNDLLNSKTEKGYNIIKGRFSPVIKSNFLELINFATTVLVDPFKQVDLRHTTTHVIIVTPGSGLYDVDYDLLNVTGKKLLSLEMTMDLICLSRAPLHIVPLFRYLDYEETLHYCIPNWLSIFFWNDSTKDAEEWHPRCKIYDLQMMGLTDNEIVEQAEIPFLQPDLKKNHSINELIENYEKTIFDIPKYQPQLIKCGADTTNAHNSNHNIFANGNGNDSPVNANKQYVWKQPTYSEAVIDEVQKFDVTADLYTTSDAPSRSSSDKTATLDITPDLTVHHINSNNSLAIDSLRGFERKQPIKEFTKRLIHKFSNKRISTTITNPAQRTDTLDHVYKPADVMSRRPEIQRNDSKDTNNSIPKSSEKNNLFRRENSNKNLIIMKNLSILKQINDKNNKNVSNELLSSFGTESHSIASHDPFMSNFNTQSNAVNNSNLPNDTTENYTGPASYFDNNPRYDNLVYISNETWIEIKNPSVPVDEDMASKLLPVRWKDVWPHFVAKKYSKWRSFTTPADLPVTISAFPSKEDFQNNFFFRNHSVTLNIDQELYNKTSQELLRNMVYMRLVAGFQLCVGKQVEKLEQLRESVMNESVVVKYIDNKNWEDIKIYMIIDAEIHRISCAQNGTIDVQRYLRKNDNDQFDQVPSYTPLVKTRYETKFRDSMVDPIHIKRPSFNWNQIDQILAGYGDYIVDKKWHGFRSKFVILPSNAPPNNFSIVVNGNSETLSLEELRVEGLRRLIYSITKSKLQTENERAAKKSKKDEIQPEVMFYTGSLFNLINDQQGALKTADRDLKNSLFAVDKTRFNRSIEMYKLAHELQHGDDKLLLVNRKWHWKKHQHCFIGSEMVSWLVRNFSDIETREDAIIYGQGLMDKGMFHHVLNTHNFLDGHYFYQFNQEYRIDLESLEKMNSNTPSIETNKITTNVSNGSVQYSVPLSSVPSKMSEFSTDNSRIKNQENSESKKPVLLLSNSLVIDVDPLKKSYREEACTVHYDIVHNPNHCFHIRLEWLTTTPKLIDDLLGNWSRMCERYGLKLVELPWEELCSIPSMNPFHSFAQIDLAINPWEDPEFNDIELFSASKFYYHIQLLKYSGFLLDNRASRFLQENNTNFDIMYSWGKPQFKYAQYIHNTGAYIAEIRENGALFLAPNNIYISRVTPSNVMGKYHQLSKNSVEPQTLMTTFMKAWTDYSELHEIFNTIKEKWTATRNVDEF